MEKSERSSTAAIRLTVAAVVVIAAVAAYLFFTRPSEPVTATPSKPIENEDLRQPNDLTPRSTQQRARVRAIKFNSLRLWWDSVPTSVRQNSLDTGNVSNIRPRDYAGPESCKKCHKENYQLWSDHPHRWMNALATDANVKGDFSGDAKIQYLGGTATFFRKGDKYHMQLVRGQVTRLYEIHQTIGSRFYQYYVGTQLVGPEPKDHPFYQQDHVLPFGYWLDYKQWVPAVHIQKELPDGEREDPFGRITDKQHPHFAAYATSCNYCHTTFSFGDMLIRNGHVQGRHAPFPVSLSMPAYLAEAHPEVWSGEQSPQDVSDQSFEGMIGRMIGLEAPKHAITLGVSCEACHLGTKEHAEGKLKRPRFFPSSNHLLIETQGKSIDFGRTAENVNWVCGRCHAGERSQFAGGMSTWNSTEYTDARRGSCYSQLTCINCHNPHEGIGKKWKHTPESDDASCIKCHQKYEAPVDRQAHTHHPMGSSGSRCMNCHMPHLNEGMQDVVRTHTIFSPTKREMIESNHPNACNQCHTDKPIDWTLNHLEQWYGATYADGRIAESYPKRKQSVALGWLESEHESVRMIGADSLIRQRSKWALPNLMKMLDDRYLLNRQFAQRGLEQWLDVRLLDHGYRFYMTAPERRDPLKKIQATLLKE